MVQGIQTIRGLVPIDVPSHDEDYWQYPDDWLDVRWPADNSIELLYCDAGSHIAAFKVTTSTGTYHVDWGDGTTNDYSSDALAEHTYTEGAGTYCSRGYYTWKIIITGNTGNLTRFYVAANSVQTETNQTGFLAACFNCSALNSMANAFYSTTGAGVRSGMLEYFKCERVVSSVTNASSAFTQCWRLLFVDVRGLTAVTNTSSMFNSCYCLQYIDITMMVALQNASSMFAYCYSLRYLDISTITTFTDISQICRSCYALDRIFFNATLSSVTSFEYGCSSCLVLRSVDISGMINVTNLNYAFQNCYNLKTANLAGLEDVTTMISCFNACYNLEVLTATNFGNSAASTVATDAFALCERLVSIALSTAKFTKFGAYGATSKLNKTTAITFSASSAFSGTTPQFDMRYNDMSGAQIDTIFTALPSVSATIDITGCTGAAACTPTIATTKGWTVTGGP